METILELEEIIEKQQETIKLQQEIIKQITIEKMNLAQIIKEAV
jgi:hypothetical protein